MNRFVIDTNIYSAFKSNHKSVITKLQEAEQIIICTVVYAEMRAGFKCGNREDRNTRELVDFLDRPRVHFTSCGAATAEHYANIYKQLRAKGTPIPTHDIWIAASAMEHGIAVYTFDQHFRAVDGLITIFAK